LAATTAEPRLDDAYEFYAQLRGQVASSRRELPSEFDLSRYLPLTEHLLKRDASDITATTKLFRLNTLSTLRKYDLVTKGLPPTTPSSTIELLNNSIFSLISTHYSTPRWKRLGRLLIGEFVDFTEFPAEHRIWLLWLANVSAWLTDLSDSEQDRRARAKQLMIAALDPRANFDIFREKTRELQPAVYLSHSAAERFYEAARELYARWANDADQESSERLRDAIARTSGRLFRFRQAS
jgi:hypothetical protein